MERYTEKHYGENGYYLVCSGNCETLNCGDYGILDKIVDRLAAYEDTGLEPEEVRSQKELFDYLVFDSTPSKDIERFKRLRELAEADRLIGMAVYEPNKRGFISTYEIISVHILKCSILVGWNLLGYLPGDGECGHVYRDGGEWYDQDMTEAVFDIEFNQLARSENSDELCCVLPVQYGFRPLIYTQRGLLYRISGPQELCAAMTGTRRFFREPATLGFCDHESVLYLSCLRPEIPGEIWAQLEKIDWGTGNDDGREDD